MLRFTNNAIKNIMESSPRADECYDEHDDVRGWDEAITESESAPSLQQVSNTESAESAEENESPPFEGEVADAPVESPKEDIQYAPHINLEQISNFQPLPENSDTEPYTRGLDHVGMDSPSFEEKLAEALSESPKREIQHAHQINLDQVSNFPPQLNLEQILNFPQVPDALRISSSTRSLNADGDYEEWKRSMNDGQASKVDSTSRMPPRSSYLLQNRPRVHAGHRLYAQAAEIEGKKAILKEEMDARILAQMRSKPQLITKHTRSASFGNISDSLGSPWKTSDRLYQMAVDKTTAEKALREKEQSQPKKMANPKKLVDLYERGVAFKAEHERKSEMMLRSQKPTFSPRISPRATQGAREFTFDGPICSPHERLYEQRKTMEDKKRNELLSEAKRGEGFTFQPNISVSQKFVASTQAIKDPRDLYDPYYLQMREQKHLAEKNKPVTHSFKPDISKSQMNVRSSPIRAPEDLYNPHWMLDREAKLSMSQVGKDMKECTFSPKTTKKAPKARGDGFVHLRLYDLRKTTAQKVQVEKEGELKRVSKHTFSPNIKKSQSWVRSSSIDSPADLYNPNWMKERDEKIAKLKLKTESEGCTFAPNTTKGKKKVIKDRKSPVHRKESMDDDENYEKSPDVPYRRAVYRPQLSASKKAEMAKAVAKMERGTVSSANTSRNSGRRAVSSVNNSRNSRRHSDGGSSAHERLYRMSKDIALKKEMLKAREDAKFSYKPDIYKSQKNISSSSRKGSFDRYEADFFEERDDFSDFMSDMESEFDGTTITSVETRHYEGDELDNDYEGEEQVYEARDPYYSEDELLSGPSDEDQTKSIPSEVRSPRSNKADRPDAPPVYNKLRERAAAMALRRQMSHTSAGSDRYIYEDTVMKKPTTISVIVDRSGDGIEAVEVRDPSEE